MNRLKHIKEDLHDRIVTVAYGDAGIIDKLKVYFNAAKNPDVKKLLAEYKETAKAVSSFKEGNCPDGIIDSVNKKIKSELNSSRKDMLPLSTFLKKPVVVFSTAVIVLGISALLIFNKPENKPEYSKTQVELAEKQVKESFALVGEVFKKTQYKLAEDVLGKQVSPPIKKGINLINNLFKGG